MKGMHSRYFLEETLSHLKPQQGLSERYQRRAIDVTLAAKLTLTYGKYHLALLHRQIAMSEEQTTYQQSRIDYDTVLPGISRTQFLRLATFI